MLKVDEAYRAALRYSRYSDDTLGAMNSIFKLYIEEFWQTFDLMSITAEQVQSFVNWLFDERKLPSSYVRRIMGIFQAMLGKCQKLQLLDRVPEFPRIVADSNRTRFLSPDEARLILDLLQEMSPLWHDIVLLTLNTGMRLGEVVSLKGENVDPVNRIIILLKTKNGKKRVIPLNDDAFAVCKKYCRRANEYLFESPVNKGKHIQKNSYYFRKVLKKTTINQGYSDRHRICFHSLRHTFASWLVQEGVRLEIVSDLLGHSSVVMSQRYAHLAPDAGRAAVAKLPSLT